MAKIIENTIVIKFSKIARDTDSDPQPAVTSEHIVALSEVAQELVGSAVIVEIEQVQ